MYIHTYVYVHIYEKLSSNVTENMYNNVKYAHFVYNNKKRNNLKDAHPE